MWAYLAPLLWCTCLYCRRSKVQKAQPFFEETSQVVWKAVLLLGLESWLLTGFAQQPTDNNKGKSNHSTLLPRLTGASAQAVLQAWQALLMLSVSVALSSVQMTANAASFVPRCLKCILILFQSWIRPRNLELLAGTGLGKLKGRYTSLRVGRGELYSSILPLEKKAYRKNYPLCKFLSNGEVMEVVSPGKIKTFLLTEAQR